MKASVLALSIMVLAVVCGCSGGSAIKEDDARIRQGMSRSYTPEELAKMGVGPNGKAAGPPPGLGRKKAVDESGK